MPAIAKMIAGMARSYGRKDDQVPNFHILRRHEHGQQANPQSDDQIQ